VLGFAATASIQSRCRLSSRTSARNCGQVVSSTTGGAVVGDVTLIGERRRIVLSLPLTVANALPPVSGQPSSSFTPLNTSAWSGHWSASLSMVSPSRSIAALTGLAPPKSPCAGGRRAIAPRRAERPGMPGPASTAAPGSRSHATTHRRPRASAAVTCPAAAAGAWWVQRRR